MLLKSVNTFTGRPNVFQESWQGLVEEFDLSKEEMGNMLARFPAIMDVSMNQKIWPLRETLANWGVPFSSYRKIVVSFPGVVKVPIQTKLWPLCKAFVAAGFQKKEFGSLVTKFPVLLYRPPGNISPRLKELQSIGLPTKGMISAILEEPRLLRLNMEQRIDWFESLLGDNGLYVMRLLLVTNPQILMGSVDDLSTKVGILEAFGISRSDREAIIRTQPFVLGENIDDLEEKLRIVRNQFGKGPDSIISFPEYLIVPIEIISERAAYLTHCGVCCNDHELDIFLGDTMKFVSQIGSDLTKFSAFCSTRELEITSKQVKSLLEVARSDKTLA